MNTTSLLQWRFILDDDDFQIAIDEILSKMAKRDTRGIVILPRLFVLSAYREHVDDNNINVQRVISYL
jgi:hypothetical protein